MSVAQYMQACLLDPKAGYYMTRDPLGVGGDFTTAPETSQMFGEIIGLALAQCWLDQGSPAPFALVEAGPGRGTLMADLLRATSRIRGFAEAAQLHLIEVSPAMRRRQERMLSALWGKSIAWHNDFNSLPKLPIFLVANEFFDALPIEQFKRCDQGWRQRQITAQQGQFLFGLGDPQPWPQLARRLEDTRAGDILEICPQAIRLVQNIGAHIAAHGGAALIIDYGGWRSRGETLQAVRCHAHVDVLDAPGEADLSAQVDFEALTAAAGAVGWRLTPQGVFLERLGITERAKALAQRLEGPKRDAHIAAHRCLTHPQHMGLLFKVLALFPKTAPSPAGHAP